MGTFIVLTAVALEIGVAVLSIITKSYQQRLRSIIRIASFAGFVLLTILSIINWGLRYYFLSAGLLLLAVIAAITLIRKKEEKRAYSAKRVVLHATGMMVLIFVLTLPAIIFPQHKALETTGEHQVGIVTYTYTDSNRIETYTNTGQNRKLNVKLWFPENADGTHPLIVFSHGGFGVKSSNESLYNELASHGYVVCSIDHTYQSFFTTDEDGHTTLIDLGYVREVSAENARSDRQQSYEYYQKWMEIRTGDIDFVLDYVLAQAEQSGGDQVYKLVDIARIGVMGHSLGGSAALGIGRTRDDVKAVIGLEAPFMYDIEGVADGEFVFTDEKYPVPVLNVYSDSSWRFLGEWPQYAKNYALLHDTNSAAFNVHINGVGHLGLTDFGLTSPFLTRILDGKKSTTDIKYCLKIINKICLEFFDSYLKGAGEFRSEGTY